MNAEERAVGTPRLPAPHAGRRPQEPGKNGIWIRLLGHSQRNCASSLTPSRPHALTPLIPVVILAGGFGARLQSVVADRPKVLAPVAGRPFLQHLLKGLADEGVRDVVLSTGHLGEQVDAFVAANAPDGMRVRCVHESRPLGTGGALAFAAKKAEIQGPFVAMNGDTFFGGAVAELVEAHNIEPDSKATLALARVDSAGRYGGVLFEDAEDKAPVRVTGFAEKETVAQEAGSVWINAGVYVLASDALADVPRGERVSLERVVFPQLVDEGTLWALRYPDASFLDIGTPEDYARAALLLG